MTTLKTFLDSKSITPEQVFLASRRIEAGDNTSRALLLKRAQKRSNKELATKKYDELGLTKPPAFGRGLTESAISVALVGKAQSRKVRAKVLRAVNTILAQKKLDAADMKSLFAGVEVKKGKVVKKDAKK
jgi:hypothetical protein